MENLSWQTPRGDKLNVDHTFEMSDDILLPAKFELRTVYAGGQYSSVKKYAQSNEGNRLGQQSQQNKSIYTFQLRALCNVAGRGSVCHTVPP